MQELESLKDIFKDRIFKIPDYQRGYAWTAEQLIAFWEDVVSLPVNRSHYTGMLSLKKVEHNIWRNWNNEKWLIEDRGYKPYHVVDGQQRLTTFVIFVQSICELIKNLPENIKRPDEEVYLGSFSLKYIKEEYIVIQKPPQFIINTHKFSYEVDNPSFKFLRHKIFNEPDSGSIQETFYTLNLENAKRFFGENLLRFFNTKGLSEVEVLFKKVTQNLMFNLYEITDDFDVFVAFETMNNRGKQLSKLELLKNRLIYLTTLYDENQLQADDRFALRESINDAWKEIYYELGRNKQNPLNDDDFLIAHWIIYFQYSREKGDDYIKFLLNKKFIPQNVYAKTEISLASIQNFEEIRDDSIELEEHDDPIRAEASITSSVLSPKEIEHYVNSLKSTAVHWFNTHNPINNDMLTEEESLWIDRLNRIGMSYFRPLVTVALFASHIETSSRINLFKAIERYIFIAFRMGRALSSYGNSEFYRAAKQLANNELSVAQLIAQINQRMNWSFEFKTDSNEGYFRYEHFKNHISKKFPDDGGFYNWNGLGYFLYEYEMEKVRERGSAKIDWMLFVKGERDRVSIEHIYPQTPDNKSWKLAFNDFNDDRLKYFNGTLGNLLPLSQSINSSLQNDSFVDKKNPKFNERGEKVREGYSNGSHSEIEVSVYENWNPENIKDRGLKLLKFMERRWELKFENEHAMLDLLFLN